MFLELYLPVGFLFLVGLLLLKDEYHIRKTHKKRLEARAEVQWPVIIDTISGPISGQTKNISATGALLVCRQPLSKGEVVRCIIETPGRSLELDAEIIWSNNGYQPPNEDLPYNEIGLLFKRVSSESCNFLALAVHDRLKLDGY